MNKADKLAILTFIAEFEKDHLRTREDTGANPSCLLLWNMARFRVGLPMLSKEDLPAYSSNKRRYVMPESSLLKATQRAILSLQS